MKYFLLFFLGTAHAETVSLQASLSFLRCTNETDKTVCHREPATPQGFTLELLADEDGMPTAEHSFQATHSGVGFEATVVVNKKKLGEQDAYETELYLLSVPESDPLSGSFDFIGKTVTKGSFRLNDTLWMGKTLPLPDGSLTPFLELGPAASEQL
jgi:hypothetical protein